MPGNKPKKLSTRESYREQKEDFMKALEEARIKDWDTITDQIFDLDIPRKPADGDKEGAKRYKADMDLIEKKLEKLFIVEKSKEKFIGIDGLKTDRYVVNVKGKEVAYFLARESNEDEVRSFVFNIVQEIYKDRESADDEKFRNEMKTLTDTMVALEELKAHGEFDREAADSKHDVKEDIKDLEDQIQNLKEDNKWDEKYMDLYAEYLVELKKQENNETAKAHMKVVAEQMYTDLARLDALISTLEDDTLSDAEIQKAWGEFTNLFSQNLANYGDIINFFATQDRLDKMEDMDDSAITASLDGAPTWKPWARRLKRLPKKFYKDAKKIWGKDTIWDAVDAVDDDLYDDADSRRKKGRRGRGVDLRKGGDGGMGGAGEVIDPTTAGAEIADATRVEFGEKGKVTTVDHRKQGLLELSELVDELDAKAETSQEERSELLRKIIIAGSNGSMQEVLKIVGGREKFWGLLDEIFYNTNFAHDLRMEYQRIRNIGKAVKSADRKERGADYEAQYLGMDYTDPDIMLTRAFATTLKKHINDKKGWELEGKVTTNNLLQLFADGSGKVDHYGAAAEIRSRYPDKKVALEKEAGYGETFWQGGTKKMIDKGLADLVESNVLSLKTAGKLSQAADGVGALLEKGPVFALIWHGIGFGKNLGKWIINKVKGEKGKEAAADAWKAMGNNLKKGALYGFGGKYVVDFLKNPDGGAQLTKSPWGIVEDASERKFVSQDRHEQKMERQRIERGLSITVEDTELLALKEFGEYSFDELVNLGVFELDGDTLKININKYKEHINPDAEDYVNLERGLQQMNDKLASIYGFTAENFDDLKGSPVPLRELIESLDKINAEFATLRTFVEGKSIDVKDNYELSRMSPADRESYKQTLAFAAQQHNKLAFNGKVADKFEKEKKLAGGIFTNAIDKKLAAKDTLGVSGRVALGRLLEDVVEGTVSIEKYFRAVNVVFNNVFDIDGDGATTSPYEAEMYTTGSDFEGFIHDANRGNAPALGGAAFIASPTVGVASISTAGFGISSHMADYDPKSKSWEEIFNTL